MSLCTALCARIDARGLASADPGKGESGKSRWRGDYGWGETERKSKFITRDGCEIERRWKKVEYESNVKCKPVNTAMDIDRAPALGSRTIEIYG